MKSEERIWMVRAGRRAEQVDEFLNEGHVAIGWRELGPVKEGTPREIIEKEMKKAYPDAKPQRIGMHVSVVSRFIDEISVGDAVLTYDPEKRFYYLGKVKSGVSWRDKGLNRVRKVDWTAKVPRDRLSVSTRNSLGSLSTLFRLNPEATKELWDKSIPIEAELSPLVTDVQEEQENPEEEEAILKDVFAKSDEFIEDRIAHLDWDELQELVAGILRAMGYRTKVSHPGPDRGVDIFASPDGLGLETPRIFVEVKHRLNTQMGTKEVRAFLGGRKEGDRCLYVSTGGFSKEAKYEADRATVPITLLAMPELRDLLVQHYENLDAATTALVPLTRLYWPAK